MTNNKLSMMRINSLSNKKNPFNLFLNKNFRVCKKSKLLLKEICIKKVQTLYQVIKKGILKLQMKNYIIIKIEAQKKLEDV